MTKSHITQIQSDLEADFLERQTQDFAQAMKAASPVGSGSSFKAVKRVKKVKAAGPAKKGGANGGRLPPSKGSGGGGFGGWWNRQDLWTRVICFILAGIISALITSSLTIWNNERVGDASNSDALKAAETDLAISKIKAQAAEFKRGTHSASIATEEVVRASSFACASYSVMMQNFASESNRPQEVQQGKKLRFNPGCAWSKFDYAVTSLEGENYLIASEDTNERCGKIAPNNDADETCMALVNSHPGKKFRVIVREGGYFIAGGQNG